MTTTDNAFWEAVTIVIILLLILLFSVIHLRGGLNLFGCSKHPLAGWNGVSDGQKQVDAAASSAQAGVGAPERPRNRRGAGGTGDAGIAGAGDADRAPGAGGGTQPGPSGRSGGSGASGDKNPSPAKGPPGPKPPAKPKDRRRDFSDESGDESDSDGAQGGGARNPVLPPAGEQEGTTPLETALPAGSSGGSGGDATPIKTPATGTPGLAPGTAIGSPTALPAGSPSHPPGLPGAGAEFGAPGVQAVMELESPDGGQYNLDFGKVDPDNTRFRVINSAGLASGLPSGRARVGSAVPSPAPEPLSPLSQLRQNADPSINMLRLPPGPAGLGGEQVVGEEVPGLRGGGGADYYLELTPSPHVATSTTPTEEPEAERPRLVKLVGVQEEGTEVNPDKIKAPLPEPTPARPIPATPLADPAPSHSARTAVPKLPAPLVGIKSPFKNPKERDVNAANTEAWLKSLEARWEKKRQEKEAETAEARKAKKEQYEQDRAALIAQGKEQALEELEKQRKLEKEEEEAAEAEAKTQEELRLQRAAKKKRREEQQARELENIKKNKKEDKDREEEEDTDEDEPAQSAKTKSKKGKKAKSGEEGGQDNKSKKDKKGKKDKKDKKSKANGTESDSATGSASDTEASESSRTGTPKSTSSSRSRTSGSASSTKPMKKDKKALKKSRQVKDRIKSPSPSTADEAKKKAAKLSASEVEASKEGAGGTRPRKSSKVKEHKANKPSNSPGSSEADSPEEFEDTSAAESEHIKTRTRSNKPKTVDKYGKDAAMRKQRRRMQAAYDAREMGDAESPTVIEMANTGPKATKKKSSKAKQVLNSAQLLDLQVSDEEVPAVPIKKARQQKTASDGAALSLPSDASPNTKTQQARDRFLEEQIQAIKDGNRSTREKQAHAGESSKQKDKGSTGQIHADSAAEEKEEVQQGPAKSAHEEEQHVHDTERNKASLVKTRHQALPAANSQDDLMPLQSDQHSVQDYSNIPPAPATALASPIIRKTRQRHFSAEGPVQPQSAQLSATVVNPRQSDIDFDPWENLPDTAKKALHMTDSQSPRQNQWPAKHPSVQNALGIHQAHVLASTEKPAQPVPAAVYSAQDQIGSPIHTKKAAVPSKLEEESATGAHPTKEGAAWRHDRKRSQVQQHQQTLNNDASHEAGAEVMALQEQSVKQQHTSAGTAAAPSSPQNIRPRPAISKVTQLKPGNKDESMSEQSKGSLNSKEPPLATTEQQKARDTVQDSVHGQAVLQASKTPEAVKGYQHNAPSNQGNGEQRVGNMLEQQQSNSTTRPTPQGVIEHSDLPTQSETSAREADQDPAVAILQAAEERRKTRRAEEEARRQIGDSSPGKSEGKALPAQLDQAANKADAEKGSAAAATRTTRKQVAQQAERRRAAQVADQPHSYHNLAPSTPATQTHTSQSKTTTQASTIESNTQQVKAPTAAGPQDKVKQGQQETHSKQAAKELEVSVEAAQLPAAQLQISNNPITHSRDQVPSHYSDNTSYHSDDSLTTAVSAVFSVGSGHDTPSTPSTPPMRYQGAKPSGPPGGHRSNPASPPGKPKRDTPEADRPAIPSIFGNGSKPVPSKASLDASSPIIKDIKPPPSSKPHKSIFADGQKSTQSDLDAGPGQPNQQAFQKTKPAKDARDNVKEHSNIPLIEKKASQVAVPLDSPATIHNHSDISLIMDGKKASPQQHVQMQGKEQSAKITSASRSPRPVSVGISRDTRRRSSLRYSSLTPANNIKSTNTMLSQQDNGRSAKGSLGRITQPVKRGHKMVTAAPMAAMLSFCVTGASSAVPIYLSTAAGGALIAGTAPTALRKRAEVISATPLLELLGSTGNAGLVLFAILNIWMVLAIPLNIWAFNRFVDAARSPHRKGKRGWSKHLGTCFKLFKKCRTPQWNLHGLKQIVLLGNGLITWRMLWRHNKVRLTLLAGVVVGAVTLGRQLHGLVLLAGGTDSKDALLQASDIAATKPALSSVASSLQPTGSFTILNVFIMAVIPCLLYGIYSSCNPQQRQISLRLPPLKSLKSLGKIFTQPVALYNKLPHWVREVLVIMVFLVPYLGAILAYQSMLALAKKHVGQITGLQAFAVLNLIFAVGTIPLAIVLMKLGLVGKKLWKKVTCFRGCRAKRSGESPV